MDRLDQLERYLAADPDNLELLATFIDAAIEAGQPARALPQAEQALNAQPNHPQFSYRYAVLLRHAGRPQEAETVLGGIIAGGESHPAVLMEHVRSLFDLGAHERALHAVEQLLAQPEGRKTFPEADVIAVRALHHMGRVDDAIARAEALRPHHPMRLQLTAALATLLLDAERIDDAKRLYEEVVGAKEAGGAASGELQCVGGFVALHDQDVDAARERFAQALAANGNDGRAHLGAGMTAALAQDLELATTELERAAALMPSHLGTLNALAWLHLLRGQLDAAEAVFGRANSIDRNFGETYGGLAVVAAQKGDWPRAQEMIRTAQKLDPNSFSALYAAMLLRHPGNAPAAVDAALKAMGSRGDGDGAGTGIRALILSLAGRSRPKSTH